MAFKLSRVIDRDIETRLNGIPATALGESDRQELFSAMALLEDTIPPLGDGDIRLRREPSEWHESDKYQVALVPFENRAEPAGKTAQASIATRPVVVLPLTWRELVVRLRAGFGPADSHRESNTVRFGEVCADFLTMEVRRSEESVALTAMEFKLLRFLVQNAGRVISRDEMLNEVWGYENYPCTRTVDNHILRLRQKLELDPTQPVHFRTVHRVGYMFVLKPLKSHLT